MKATLDLDRRASYAEYLAVQQTSARRLEFIDGVIVAMAGGSDEHNAIGARFNVLLGGGVPSGWLYFTADQRFWISSTARGRYSDGSIICGKPEHPAHDAHATTNQVVVLEVLSPSSEGDDEGDKRVDFQSLVSLQAYAIAAQDERSVKVYRRDDRGAWRRAPDVCGPGDSFELPCVTKRIAVAEIYDGILDAAGRSLLR